MEAFRFFVMASLQWFTPDQALSTGRVALQRVALCIKFHFRMKVPHKTRTWAPVFLKQVAVVNP